jgi:16S rRNA C1402 N4-methylase RsmH
MRITAKFGVNAADALRLVREAEKVQIFLGEGDDRFILQISKASIVSDLKSVPAHRPRPCYLDVDSRTLFFGSVRTSHHAERVRRAAALRVAP